MWTIESIERVCYSKNSAMVCACERYANPRSTSQSLN